MTKERNEIEATETTAEEVKTIEMTADEVTALVTAADMAKPDLIEGFQNPGKTFFSSIEDDGTRESKIKIYNALNNADTQVEKMINKEIMLTDVLAHALTLPDMNTGELRECLRIVLIDENGVGYACISEGIASSLQKIMATIGSAPWNPALKVRPVYQTTKKGYKVMTLEILG